MKIRETKESDISSLVVLDRIAYDNYGADEKYFRQKFNSANTRILTVLDKGKITGFAVVERLREDEIPPDFTGLTLEKPLRDPWLHIIAFTTKTNYLDVKSDSKLVKAIEKVAEKMGLTNVCVPLSKDHPFNTDKVFDLWVRNFY